MGLLGESLKHPDEFVPLLTMARAAKKARALPADPDLSYCYGALNRVSRSFAMVTCQLPPKLRDAVCIYYLLLRALDTIEDDMALSDEIKLPALRSFWKDSQDPSWTLECGDDEYADLMRNFPKVSRSMSRLPARQREILHETARKMGAGMAEFVDKAKGGAGEGGASGSADAQAEVPTIKEYDLYCFYVAGLVGIGLSALFVSSGLESDKLAADESEAVHMALLLQKTNIIRDFLEDIEEEPRPRIWWPREIFGRFLPVDADVDAGAASEEGDGGPAAASVRPGPPALDSLEAFSRPPPGSARERAAVRALNAMIADALRHAPPALSYLSRVRNPDVLRFCAIPQAMAMATLARCFNNPAVFHGVVKMRRGEVAKIFHHLNDQADVAVVFRINNLAIRKSVVEGGPGGAALGSAANSLSAQARAERRRLAELLAADPSRDALLERTEALELACAKRISQLVEGRARREEAARTRKLGVPARATVVAIAVLYLTLASNADSIRALLGVPPNENTPMLDRFNQVVASLFFGYAVLVAAMGRKP